MQQARDDAIETGREIRSKSFVVVISLRSSVCLQDNELSQSWGKGGGCEELGG